MAVIQGAIQNFKKPTKPGVLQLMNKQAQGIVGNVLQGAYNLGADISKIQRGAIGQDTGIPQGFVGNQAEILQTAGQNIAEASQRQATGQQGAMETSFQQVGQAPAVVGKTISNIFGSALSTVVSPELKQAGGEVMQNIFETAKGKKALEVMQGIQKGYEGLSPRTQANLAPVLGVGEIGLNLAPIPGAGKVGQVVGKGLEKVPGLIEAGAKKLPGMVKPVGNKIISKISKTPEQQIAKGENILFEAVNPTTRENKAVLKQRVQDLEPFIDNNPLKNRLEDVKARIDVKRNDALSKMQDYESTVGVKGIIQTDEIIKKLSDKFQEKIGKSYINPDEAKIADQLIKTLKGFGKTVTDANIIKIRRAWDDIIEKNKGFMQSADSNIKGDIFNEANKFFREEIRKSNPQYANFLKDFHTTKTIGDVVEATIQRRVGQQGGGFIKRGLQATSRVAGAGLGGLPGYIAAEALIQGGELLSSSAFKLTKGAKILRKAQKKLQPKKTTNGMDSNGSRMTPDNSVGRVMDIKERLKPKKPLTVKKVLTKPQTQVLTSDIRNIELKSLVNHTKKFNNAKEFVDDVLKKTGFFETPSEKKAKAIRDGLVEEARKLRELARNIKEKNPNISEKEFNKLLGEKNVQRYKEVVFAREHDLLSNYGGKSQQEILGIDNLDIKQIEKKLTEFYNEVKNITSDIKYLKNTTPENITSTIEKSLGIKGKTEQIKKIVSDFIKENKDWRNKIKELIGKVEDLFI